MLRGKLAAELVADALPAEKQAVAPSAVETEEEPQIGQGLAILGAALAAAKKEERATTAIVPAAPAPLDLRPVGMGSTLTGSLNGNPVLAGGFQMSVTVELATWLPFTSATRARTL